MGQTTYGIAYGAVIPEHSPDFYDEDGDQVSMLEAYGKALIYGNGTLDIFYAEPACIKGVVGCLVAVGASGADGVSAMPDGFMFLDELETTYRVQLAQARKEWASFSQWALNHRHGHGVIFDDPRICIVETGVA